MSGKRPSLRIGVLAGEASGDILGAHVLRSLRQRVGHLQIEGIGGPLMEAEGLVSMVPMDRLSVMGFVEPFKRLPELLGIRGRLYRHFRDNPPDLFLGIDSPDFNLHLEQKLRKAGVTTVHLVSPTIWAWREGRISKIRRAVDAMLCLFPFEMPVYKRHGVDAVFVGHPLADEIPLHTDKSQARTSLGVSSEGAVVALLPGSRGGEVRLLAPLFLAAAERLLKQHPNLTFVLPTANADRHAELQQLVAAHPSISVRLIRGCSREVMAAADVVLLASGTASLEAMLLKRPMVIVYKMSALSWFLVSRLAKIGFAGLPNILADRAIVPELIQNAATPEAMAESISLLLSDEVTRDHQLRAFADLHSSLRCDSSERAAEALLALVERSGLQNTGGL